MSAEEDERYLRAIAELVLHLRQLGHFLSPMDLQQMGSWADAAVPLPAVLRGIRLGAERLYRLKRPPRGLPLKRLTKDVAKEAKLLQRGSVGASLPPEALGQMAPAEGTRRSAWLEALSARLADAAIEPAVAREVASLATETDLDDELVFAELAGLSRRWYEARRLALSPVERGAIEERASAALPSGALEKLAPDARVATVAELVRRSLRTEDGVFDPERFWEHV